MNKELKKDIEDLAQAQRLKDEESFYADNVVAAFKYGEEIEDKVRYIKKLEKRIRLFWGVLGLGLLAVLLVITYSIYSLVFCRAILSCLYLSNTLILTTSYLYYYFLYFSLNRAGVQ